MSGISGSSMCMSDGTFAPVAKLTNSLPSCISICFSLLVAPSTGRQKCFFRNGDPLEIIYMDPPPSLRAKGEYLEKVCHLCMSLYGLQKSSRTWFSCFSDVCAWIL